MDRADEDHSPTHTGTDDLLPTRRSLLGRLKDWSDHASWQVFFDTYWRLIYRVALKAGCTESEAEEVVQQTMISAAKAMKDFRYDPAQGSFKGWLLQLTGWRITSQLRRRRLVSPLEPGDDSPELDREGTAPPAQISIPPELERLWDTEWEDNLLGSALERVRTRINPKHFQIFDLCVIQHKPVQEVRQFLGVSAMEIYLSRHRVARLVRQEIARLRERVA